MRNVIIKKFCAMDFPHFQFWNVLYTFGRTTNYYCCYYYGYYCCIIAHPVLGPPQKMGRGRVITVKLTLEGTSSSTQPSNASWDLWKTCCLWPSLVIANVQKAPVARFSGWWKAFVEQKVQPCGKKRIATKIILESYHTFQTCKQFDQKRWLFYSETFDSQKYSEIKQWYSKELGLL